MKHPHPSPLPRGPRGEGVSLIPLGEGPGMRVARTTDQALSLSSTRAYLPPDRRAHREWTAAQISFLANIVRLYRGEEPDFTLGDGEAEEKLRQVFGKKPKYTDVARACAKPRASRRSKPRAGASTLAVMSASLRTSRSATKTSRNSLKPLNEELETLNAQERVSWKPPRQERGGNPRSMSAVPQSQLILYRAPDGQTRIQCRFEDENVWLTQALMAELFQVTVPTINEHLKGIYAEGELPAAATIRSFRIVRSEGARQVTREIEHYNLEAILAVGYRVRSPRGAQFRQWATARLKEYLVKGFTMDDERLKNPPGKGHKDYFDELLERIRDIRSSERRFYQKVLEIYATSVDYDPTAEASQQFFATVQNKMHWATHGRTAAELIHQRADAEKPFMGHAHDASRRAGPQGGRNGRKELSHRGRIEGPQPHREPLFGLCRAPGAGTPPDDNAGLDRQAG